MTVYISSEKAVRHYRKAFLNSEIEPAVLESWDTDPDLFAFGAMIGRALRGEATFGQSVRPALGRYLEASGMTALDLIVKRLTDGDSDEETSKRYYKETGLLAEDLRKLQPQYMWPMGLAELSNGIEPHSVQLRSGTVGLTAKLVQVIDHPLFQRLKGLEQLEYVHFLYPSAHHTRFEHSLETFSLAKTLVGRLLQFPEFRLGATSTYVLATLLAALLHDVGHFPLSHMFEDYAVASEKIGGVVVPTDELVFQCLLGDGTVWPYEHEINERAKAILGDTYVSLRNTLEVTYPQSLLVLRSLIGDCFEATAPVSTLRRLLSSSIDIDKISYLQSDAHQTGVHLGSAIDLPGLIRSLSPLADDDIELQALAVTEDGLASAEAIVMARYWMIQRVYWHRANRAIIAMHKFVINDLVGNGALSFLDYFLDTLFSSHREGTAYLSRAYSGLHSGNADFVNPLEGLLHGQRLVYKRLLTKSRDAGSRKDEELFDALKGMSAQSVHGLGEELRIELNKSQSLRSANIHLRYGELLIEVPVKKRDRLEDDVRVYLDRGQTERKWLSGPEGASHVLRQIDKDYGSYVKKARVFIAPRVMVLLHTAALTAQTARVANNFLLKWHTERNRST